MENVLNFKPEGYFLRCIHIEEPVLCLKKKKEDR